MPTLRAGSDVSSSISAAPGRRGTTALLIAAAIGGAVSVAVGVYAKQHDPTNEQILHVGFPSTLSMKAWLTTGVFVLAIVQAVSAAWMWGRLPRAGAAPRWVAHAHRWTGTAAFLLALPVAYHCLWSLGWRSTDARVVVHGDPRVRVLRRRHDEAAGAAHRRRAEVGAARARQPARRRSSPGSG